MNSESERFQLEDEWDPEPEDAIEEQLEANREGDSRSLYSLLNVPTDASASDIQRAYRTLAPALHPDKHPEHLREAASKQFQQAQRAYEILTDERTRALYDVGGEELLASGLQVGPKAKSSSELRAELRQQKQEQQIKNVNSLVRAKATVSVSLDASQVFARPPEEEEGDFVYQEQEQSEENDDDEDEEADDVDLDELLARLSATAGPSFPSPLDMVRRLSNVWVTSQVLRSTFDVPINPATRFTFTGRSMLSARRAGANLLGTLHHQASEKLALSLSSSLFTTSPTVVGKASYNFDATSFAGVSSTFRSLNAPPTFSVSTGTSIYPGWTSFAGFRTGQYALGSWGYGVPMSLDGLPAFTLGISNRKGIVVTTETSIRQTTLSIQLAQKVWGTNRVKIATALSTLGGFSINCEGETKGPLDTTSSASVGFGTAGVLLKLSVSRLGQSVVIPITLSHEPAPLMAFTFILVPTVSFAAAQYLFLQPRKRRRKAERLAELRVEHAKELLDRRIEAESERALLEEQANRRATNERGRGGLVVLRASYRPAKPDDAPDVEALDVVVPLQALVTNSQLIIPGGKSKSGMLGFCDPCPGIKKVLQVEYEFRGVLHRVTCGDKAGLAIPLQEHLVS